MKHGYICQCGWRLGRGRLTRRQYAGQKEVHAETCETLREELKRSGKIIVPAPKPSPEKG